MQKYLENQEMLLANKLASKLNHNNKMFKARHDMKNNINMKHIQTCQSLHKMNYKYIKFI